MNTLCLGALRTPSRILSRSRWRKSDESLALPYELWSEIFHMLDENTLVVVSRVSRAFNAHSIPIYLARRGIPIADLHAGTLAAGDIPRPDIFPVLRTAFFLPPIRKFSCAVWGNSSFQVIRYLASFISQQATLEDVRLTFYNTDPFTGYGRKQKALPRRTVQRAVCRLLDSVTPTGKTLVISPDRLLISGSARWRLVRPIAAPPRGIRAKVRKVALAVKERKPAGLDLVLHTVGEIRGTMCHDSLVLDQLRSLSIKHSTSAEEWAVVVLDASSIRRLNVKSMLNAADWLRILPLLELPQLVEFSMGRPTVNGRLELYDIPIAELDAFLIRHTNILHLEYLPQLPPEAPIPEFSLASLPHLTRLTTTPAHLIHLHHAPNMFRALVELTLLAPASTPMVSLTAQFMAVLNLLGDSSDANINSAGVCLRFPGAWISSLPAGLAIKCVASLVIFGGFSLDVTALTEFLLPFQSGLKWVEFQPAQGRTFEHMRVMDELRRKLVWLEDVSCVRTGFATQIVSHPKTRKTISFTYDNA
ncbi:hypothetical protein B0H19DRAFT_1103953 [Mycena capillaripes]|nr:hypothetical protein B0H19DRAFT_1103953 [Mycena capillaripes]